MYDFSTHSRRPEVEKICAAEHLIVEGLFTLYWPELRDLYSTKVFMEAGHELCFPRREQRDIVERGRTRESIHKQYAETVRPMADQFIRPSSAYADLMLSGSSPVPQSAAKVLEHVASTKRAAAASR